MRDPTGVKYFSTIYCIGGPIVELVKKTCHQATSSPAHYRLFDVTNKNLQEMKKNTPRYPPKGTSFRNSESQTIFETSRLLQTFRKKNLSPWIAKVKSLENDEKIYPQVSTQETKVNKISSKSDHFWSHQAAPLYR